MDPSLEQPSCCLRKPKRRMRRNQTQLHLSLAILSTVPFIFQQFAYVDAFSTTSTRVLLRLQYPKSIAPHVQIKSPIARKFRLFGTSDEYPGPPDGTPIADPDPTLVLEGELGPIDLEGIGTAKLETFQSDIENVSVKRDLSNDYFGPLLPIAERVDALTGGWGLSYADLHPETPTTPLGVAFLATNACYAFGGLILGVQGEWTLGLLTEVAGVVSFWYHYSQLNFGQDRREVRLALLVDYMTASTALLCGGVYMIQMGIDSVPIDALAWGGISVICLTLCWVKEVGYWYLFWHSLWHIFSAYTGYLVGQDHINGVSGGGVIATSSIFSRILF